VQIEIIPLAQKKAKKRKIPPRWIYETLKNPEQIVNGYGNRKVAHKVYYKMGRKMLLRVIFEESGNKKTVVSVYLTSQISRYWEEK